MTFKQIFFWTFPISLGVGLLVAPFFHRPTAQYDTPLAATVKIKRGDGTGSGFLILRRTIDTKQLRLFAWTAKHVTTGTNKVSVIRTYHVMRDTRAASTEVVAPGIVIFRAGCDAALISVESPPELFDHTEFDLTEYPVGTPIFHVGNLLGDFDTSLTRGVISQKDVNQTASMPGWPWDLMDQTDLVICPGSSGGPIFSSRGVIGLVGGGPSQGTLGIACYVPVRVIVIEAEKAHMQWAIIGTLCPSDSTVAKLAERERLATLDSDPARP